jgi:hypothetical protein
LERAQDLNATITREGVKKRQDRERAA